MMRSLALALMLMPATVVAQTAAPAVEVPAAPFDAARLDAARRTVDMIMPPEEREAMIEKMLVPLFKTIQDGMTGSLELDKLAGEDAATVRSILDRHMDRVQQRTLAQMKQAFPGMIAAMERAYARRFTVVQLKEIATFYATPTGQIYRRESVGIMSDPDIQSWQRTWIEQAMKQLPQDAEQLKRELDDWRASKAGKRQVNPT